ncbi:tudor domain-containing protein 15 [Clarias gariepinus]
MLTHTDCSPENTLVHFQGQYASICELDYKILHVEIQNVPKTTVPVEVGDSCLVEDLLSSSWYRGRVQNRSENLFDVFLLDHGNILTVDHSNLSTISDSLLMLPPKIVCGFIANVLPIQECWDELSQAYFSSLIGRHVNGYIHGLLPYKVLILEMPEITKDLLRLSLGRHVDTDTFLLLVELVVEAPIQQSYESVPDLLIEKQIAEEIAFKSSNLRSYENVLYLSSSKLIVGQKERVRIAAAVQPGLFYCQLSSAANDLKEMSEKLAVICESRNANIKDKPGERLGLLCAIKGKDEKWHRGLVQCLPVNSQVRVVFVDYGYCESVKVENIFQLPSDFLLTPIMTFPCSLSCLGDKDKDTVNQQLVLLRGGLLGKELVITVDNVSKEKNVCSVTLSNIAEYALIKTVQSKEVDKMAGNERQLGYIPTEATKDRISKNLVAFEDIQDGSVFEGYVEHVQNPQDFWVRTTKSNYRFEAMMNKLTDCFSRLQLNEEILQDPVPGQLCCAMYEKDMHYYRAVVVDNFEHEVEVFFIDFGNTEKVPSTLIKKMPTKLTVEPEFALNCSLAHVIPLEDVWTATATDFFRKVTSNKALLCHVIYRRGDVLVVELYDKRFEESHSITTLLTSAKMADYWAYRASELPVGKDHKTCKKVVRSQFAEKKRSQKLTNKEPRQEIKQTTDKQVHNETPKYSTVDSIKSQTFKPGAVVNVCCSHVGSPADFWCQNKENKQDLDRLMRRLQTFYQTNVSVVRPQSVCCAVRFQLDKKWYRGCILKQTGINVKVILVDYGMVVQEKLQNLQMLNPEFLELEAQAFRCSLCNLIGPVEGAVWSDNARTLLKHFTSENLWNLKCKIYSQVFIANQGLCNMVDLYIPSQQASAYLVEKGVAKEIQHPYELLPSVYPCSFVYSSFDISIGSEELVFPTQVVSPWEIYFQLDRNTEIIEQLMDRVMKESQALLSLAHPDKTGSVCLAKYSEDGKWYRSFVWPAQSSQHFNVIFVDYGSKQVAEKNNLLPIPRKAADLLLTPMQALRCSLSGIPEEEHLPEVNRWLEKATLNKELRAKFVSTNSSGHFVCDLFDGDIHINEKVKVMIAIHRVKDISVRKPISDGHKDFMIVSSVGNKLNIRRKNHVRSLVKPQRTPGHCKVIQGIVQSCQSKSSKLKCPQKSHNLKGCSENNGQTKENPSLKIMKVDCTIPSTSNMHSSNVLPNVSDLPAVKIAPGFKSVGFISHCDFGDSFFIQMQMDEQNILKMREELNSTPFTESLQCVTSNVKEGDLVAARYDEDLALYRAAVNSVASSSHLTVEFIDYGNRETVDKMKIHPLASKFLSVPRLSIHCKLSNLYNSGDVKSFPSDAKDKPLVVEFLQNLGYAWEVSVQQFQSKELVPAEGSNKTEDKVSGSDQAKQSQELYGAVYDCDTSLPSIGEDVLEAVSASIEEKTTVLESVLKEETTVLESVQEKTLDKVQATRATDCIQHHPTSTVVTIPPEMPVNKEDEIQRLSLAPVKRDHEYSGFAAAITTPGEFCIVFDDLLFIMHALSIFLEDLPEDLAPVPEAHLIPGTGCLVKSDQMKKWCRAEIIQCDNESVIINLVDYGHYLHMASQDVCNLKMLTVELASLPKITYPCMLRGIKPADELQWSDRAAMFFQQCLYQKALQIHFREYVSEAQWEVDIVTSNRNVAKELVDAGYAHYIDNLLGIRFQLRLGRKSEIKSNSLEGKHEQTQAKMERTEDASSSRSGGDEICEGCSTEGEREDSSSGSSDKQELRK